MDPQIEEDQGPSSPQSGEKQQRGPGQGPQIGFAAASGLQLVQTVEGGGVKSVKTKELNL